MGIKTVRHNGAYYLPAVEIAKALQENRIGELTETGNEVNSEGTKEADLKFAVFTHGTIGMRVVDAFRITPQGRIYEGYCPIPVMLADVTYADENEVLECIEVTRRLDL